MIMMTMLTTKKSLCGEFGSLYNLKKARHFFWHMTLHRLVTDTSEIKYIIAALGISELAKSNTATQNVSVCERYTCHVHALQNVV